jgi:signal transduction histidine kinase
LVPDDFGPGASYGYSVESSSTAKIAGSRGARTLLPTVPFMALKRLATPRTAAVVGIFEGALAIAVVVISTIAHKSASGLPVLVLVIALLAVGTVVAYRRPAHRMGWIMLGASGFLLLTGIGGSYAVLDYREHHGALALGPVAVVLQLSWAPAIVLFLLAVVLYPDGRLPSRRWRWPVFAVLAIAGVWQLGAYAIAADTVIAGHIAVTSSGDLAQIDQPSGAWAWWGVVQLLFFGASAALLIAWVRSQVVGYRELSGERRMQQKWLLAGAAVASGSFVLIIPDVVSNAPIVQTLGNLAPVGIAAIPVAIGIGILRFHLYDLDVVVSRSIAYGALALTVSALYVAVVVVLSLLVHHGSRSLGVSLIATVFAAAAFQPLRTRAQRMADRIVYGRRATPYEAVTHLADRLAGSYDVDRVLIEAAQVLVQATAAERGDVWLRAQNGLLAPLATWPAHVTAPEPLPATMMQAGVLDGRHAIAPVRHQGVLLGAVGVSKRVGEAASQAELRLLGHLASQAGLVLHNAKLAADLQRRLEDLVASRQRLVRAQDEARRRLERDLHDGAQQRLIALNMKLGQLRSHFQEADREAEAALEQLRSELDAALDDIRTTSRGIYPPLLADRGLEAALRSHVRTVPVPVTVNSTLEERCSREVEAAAYFCALEALQNVYRHAGADRATVRLDRFGDVLRLEVEDDGHGFDTARIPTGSGLTNIADRVDALGGGVETRSTQGSGTTIAIELPL